MEQEKRGKGSSAGWGSQPFSDNDKKSRADEPAHANKGVPRQKSERGKSTKELNRTTRLYAFISQVNHDIVRLKDEKRLFYNACSIAIEFGKFKMAWIGIFDKENNTITAVDQKGIPNEDLGYFKNIPLVTNGPLEGVLNTGNFFISNDITHHAALGKWRAYFKEYDISSLMIIPIKKSGDIVGTFNLYAVEADFFKEDEIDLLVQLANDISFALDLFENEKNYKHTQELIIQNEKRFRALVENSTDAIAILTPEGNINYISPSVRKMLGYTEQEARKVNKFSIIHPDDLPEVKKVWAQMLESNGVPVGGVTSRKLHKDGTWRWVEATFTNLLLDPAIKGIVDNFRDVTEGKLAEEGLLLTQLAIDNAEDAVLWMTTDARIVKVNEAACTMLGYKRDDLVKLIIPDIDPNYNAEKWPVHFNDLREKGSLFFESVQMAKDGRLIPVEIRANYIKLGKAEFNCAFIRDISQRKRAEAERTQMVNDLMMRNIELEQFGYIISHNLRAPVANIIGASNALSDPELDDDDKETLSRGINQSVTKLDNVVKDLNHILQVKGEVNNTKQIVRFSELVDDIKASISSLIEKDNIKIQYDFAEVNEFLTLKPYLYSVFYNLISNSIKYRRKQIQTVIKIKSLLLKDKIELIFSDNGMGIDLDKSGNDIFGLYKRFHTNIEGKGMGLFMVKTQVETLGGKISLKSKENEGTEFRIEFDL